MTTTDTSEAPPRLEMRGIGKRFAGVRALDGVSLTASAGQVLALMGENGAGKSTLMKILGGVQPPDTGEIRIDGRSVHLDDVRAAKRHGIALIHQELMLAPNLDIAANIFLGNEGAAGMLAPLPRATMNRKAAALLERVGLGVPPTLPLGALTVGQMQMVEIARALSADARILIMDEPTASLSAAESARLFEVIHRLRAEGVCIIYISHRMEEVQALADRVTVLRDGRWAGDLTRAEAKPDRIVALMVGRELTGDYFPPKHDRTPGEVVLEVKDLVVPGAPAGVSFSARRGEILGFAGLVGAGRTELMTAVFGVTPARAGTMMLEGAPFAPRNARDAIHRGVYLAPEDRKHQGLVLPMSITENTTLPNLPAYSRWGRLDAGAERRVAEAEVARMATRTPSVRQKVVNLSGGNQQKVVLGKWLAMSPKVLILDEPTRGIDVGARAEIYRHVAGLAKEGIAVLVVSSDMEEVIGLCDRVLVMRERRAMGVLERDEISQERIGTLMTGGHAEVAA
ncbi:MAG TPA: sugar ABC transporter ATP-binding protein [Polyangia bacterium]|nr:sugar ABC transporter ATP-binding protein [Polyangia bacterium]